MIRNRSFAFVSLVAIGVVTMVLWLFGPLNGLATVGLVSQAGGITHMVMFQIKDDAAKEAIREVRYLFASTPC